LKWIGHPRNRVQKADPSQIYGVYNTTTTTIISSTDVLEVSDSENESDDADHEAKKMIHTSTDPIEIKDTILDEAQAESSDASVSTLDSMSECDGVSDDSSIDSDYDAGEKTEKRVKNDALAKEAEASKNEQLSQEDALALFQKLLNIDADAVDSDEVKMEGVQFNKESNSITLTLSKPDENIESAKSEVTIEDSMSLDDSLSEDESRKESSDCDEKGTQKSDDEASAESPVAEPSVEEAVPFLASRIINGRQVCNLSDHNIQAGCTSIVAVLVGRTLTVANAGDSRAVLCRAGGITHPLSFDHKPQQEREMNRILNAGGFVNQFGRVNGNLNLSRSIGDLKYKQTPGIPPDQQMITSEPDITSVELQDGDEFLIIGCDGIWDCLTNEGAVKYVKDRIDTKRCEDILREMLDEIISDDPRASQGIGGDNMTCMIVDLLPHARAHYAYQSEEQEPSPLAIVEAEEMKSGEMAEELV
jgi:serine/threonine protein phosphatase PrpC